MSDSKFADVIFMMFGKVYARAVQELSMRGPDAMYTAFAGVVNEGRKRSGLSPAQTLVMIKVLKKVLDRVIEQEGG